MRLIFAILSFLFAMQANASSYYCNGAVKESGSSWYYPSGAVAQSGNSTYYENGAILKSGPSLYFRSGAIFVSNNSMYYSNGTILKSGPSFYHANGSALKSGPSCYYENGSSMGSCPDSLRIQAGLGSNDLEVDLNLKSGELSKIAYSFDYNGQSVSVALNAGGMVSTINFECTGSGDSEVRDLLKNYQSLSSDQKSQVRKNICH